MTTETFNVTQTTVLNTSAPHDGDAAIDPGEQVTTTVTITNNSTTPGPQAATGVQFSEILDGMTIVDQPGALDDINVSPIAFNDTYNVVGNTTFTADAANGVLGGATATHLTLSADAEFFSHSIGASPAQTHIAVTGVIPTANGSITLNADGSFTYTPNIGFTGTDSFTYQLVDPGLDGSFATPGDNLTGAATVTFNVEDRVWFIDNTAPGSTNVGTQANPFTSIDAFNQANGDPGGPQPGDIVYLRAGTYTETDGINLLNGQTLVGQGENLVVNHSQQGNIVVETGSAGQTPVIVVTGAGNQGIQLAQNNSISGLDVGMNNATAVGIADGGGTVGNLTISNVGVGVSQNLGSAVDIDQGGTLNVLLDSVTSTGAARGIDLGTTTGLAGTGNGFTVSGATTINDATSDGIAIGNSSLSATFNGAVTIVNDVAPATVADGVDLGTGAGGANTGAYSFNGGLNITVNGTNAFGFRAQSSGTVNISDVGTTQITSANGTALLINPTTLNATLDSVTSSGGSEGISLNGMSGSLVIGSVDIDGQTGDGIDITGSAGSVTVNGGTIGAQNDPGGIGVDINGGAGAVVISATINDATAANAVVDVSGRGAGAGTVDFNGNITSTGGGIVLSGNTGGTVRFDGGMNLSTGTAAAFSSTGGSTGATLVVTDTVSSSNILSTTTGTALNIANTTIGAEDLTFQSITQNGGTNAIVLNTTGSLGGLTVTGSGATDGSGGTIQNTTGRGASFIGAVDIKLSNMNFTNAGTTDFAANNSGLSDGHATVGGNTNAAIHLQTVTNVLLDNLNISGGAEQGIYGHTVANFTLAESSITNVGNAADEDNIHFFNMSGTSAITNTVLTHTSGGGDDNLNLQTTSGNLDLTISGGSAVGTAGGVNQLGSGYLFGIRGTTVANINIDGVSSTNNFSGGIVADAFGDATMNLRVNNSTSSGNNDQLSVSAGDNSKVDLEATGNTLSSVATGDFVVIGLLGSAFDTGYVFDARIHGNTISVADELVADGVLVFNAGGGVINTAITNNTIAYAGGQRAIILQQGQDGPATTRATITGNNIDLLLNGGNNADRGIEATSGVADPSGAGSFLDLNIGGAGALANTITHSLGGSVGAGGDIRVRQRFGDNINLDGYAGGPTDTAAVIAYLNSRNNEVDPASATVQDGSYSGNASPVFITVTVSAASVAENGGANLVYTFTRNGSIASSLVANFAVTGTASSATSDFAVTGATTYTSGTGLGTITFAAGSATTQITVDPTGDAAAEFNESVVVDVGNSTTANGGFARAIIANDDAAPLLAGEGGVDTVPPTETTPQGDTGTHPLDVTPPADTPPVTPAHAVIVDDGVLSQAELDWFVDAGIARWSEAGLTEAQLDALEAMSFGVADMAGLNLGAFTPSQITLDSDGAGHGWYLDLTPGDDAEFGNAHGGTRLITDPDEAPAGHYDLLTTVMHELGHALGLDDSYDAGDRDGLMYGWLFVGERRLPGAGEADGAVAGAITGEHFAGSPINVGPANSTTGGFILPAGQTVTVQWQATIDPQTNQLIDNPVNTGTVTANAPFPPASTGPITTSLDGLTLGGLIWNDLNSNGTFDSGAGETAIAGNIALTLFADTNGNNVFDDGIDTQVATTTAVAGVYSFTALAPGDYIVRIDQANFEAGGALAGFPISSPGAPEPDNNIDGDDNGARIIGQAAFSGAITLAYNAEPITDGDVDADTNHTLDFGFFANALPTADNVGPFTGDEDATLPARIAITLSGTDTDAGDAVESFTIETLAANGSLFAADTGGAALTAGAIIPATGAGPWTATVYFQPNADFNGATSFTYSAFDGVQNGAPATASITVTAVIDIADDPATTDEDVAVNVPVLDNDTFEGAPAITGFTAGASGTVTLNDNATPGDTTDDFLVYTPGANFFGADSFQYTVTSGGVPETATVNVTIDPVADTPSVTNATTDEETQTASGLVLSPNAADGAEVTHFKITNIQNGALFLSDGVTVVNDGDFITVAQGNAGLKFTPAANFSGAGSFDAQAALSNDEAGLGGNVATATITVNAVADTPSVTDATTDEDTQTASGLVISPNAGDGAEVTHVKITNVQNGTLFLNDGTTQVNNGDFITVAQANAGLRFTPTANFFGAGSFDVQASLSNSDAGLGGNVATATITVNAIADTASVTNATTDEDLQTTSGLVISPNAADGSEVTHVKITNIQNGTLFLNDGTTQANNGDFITVAQANAGLKFTPAADFFGAGSFDVQASLAASDAGLGGAIVTAQITVNAVDDAPNDIVVQGAPLAANEFVANGAVVGAVVAQDIDSAVFTYSLFDDAGGRFAINSATGQITVLDGLLLDFEQNASHNITVRANDGTSDFDKVLAVTVNNVDPELVVGDGAANTFVGGALNDIFHLEQGGADDVDGGGGNDNLLFGAIFTAAHRVDGGAGFDQISLLGDYSAGVVLDPQSFVNIEAFGFLPGFGYSFTAADGNVAAGQTLSVWAEQLAAGQSLTFNGAAETDGAFRMTGGAGDDNFVGGAGNDTFTGGLGDDALVGGAGFDSAVFSGLRSAYTLSDLGSGNVRVVGPDGDDTVSGVERLIFADVRLNWPPTAGNDFNADGFGDALWRNTANGQVQTWELDGGSGAAVDNYGAVNLVWQQVAAADTDADGKGDVVLRNTSTGSLAVWELDGAGGFAIQNYGAASVAWQSLGAGDFNGDGRGDILFRNSASGQVATWELNGSGGFAFDSYGTETLDWKIAGIGDFNNDGFDDILWRNSTNGQVKTWELNGSGGFTSDTYGAANLTRHVFGVGDFNADGFDDILWRDNSGQVATWELDGAGDFGVDFYGAAGSQWSIMHATDTSSDGKDDILWRNTSTGQVAVWELNGSGGFSFQGYGSNTLDWQIFDGNFQFV